MTVRMEIGGREFDISPLPIRFSMANAKALDRLEQSSRPASERDPKIEPLDGAEQQRLMFAGILASIQRTQPTVTADELLDLMDRESMINAWIAVMDNAAVRRVLAEVEPGKTQPVLTPQVFDRVLALGISTSPRSSPASSPAPAGTGTTSSTTATS